MKMLNSEIIQQQEESNKGEGKKNPCSSYINELKAVIDDSGSGRRDMKKHRCKERQPNDDSDK